MSNEERSQKNSKRSTFIEAWTHTIFCMGMPYSTLKPFLSRITFDFSRCTSLFHTKSPLKQLTILFPISQLLIPLKIILKTLYP